MSTEQTEPKLYGLVAEFDDSDVLLAAAKKTADAGYTQTDAHVPYPIHGLSEALGMKRTILPWIVFTCGLLGCIGGFYLQYWISAVDYPVNVGGRPYVSWPSFIPVTFECTILLAGLSSLIGMLSLNGLPRPHHPIFNAPNFEKASENTFFLCIEAEDSQFDLERTKAFMNELGAQAVSEVYDDE